MNLFHAHTPSWLHPVGLQLLLLATLLLPFLAASAGAVEAKELLRRNTHADGSGTPCRVFVPAAYESGQALPLIVFLNGSDQTGDDNESQVTENTDSLLGGLLNPIHMARQPVLLVAPQSRTEQWNTDEVIAVVAKVQAEFTVDSDRIYLTGLSTGGSAVWDTLKAYPNVFAAGVPISGGSAFEGLERLVHIPLWIFHGIEDHDTDPRYGDGDGRFGPRWLVTALRAMGGHPGYTEYSDDGHVIWDRVYADERLFPWLIAQHRVHRAHENLGKTL